MQTVTNTGTVVRGHILDCGCLEALVQYPDGKTLSEVVPTMSIQLRENHCYSHSRTASR